MRGRIGGDSAVIPLALARLGITTEQLSMAPQISPQLRMISRTLKRAGQSKTIRQQTIKHPDNAAERKSATAENISEHHVAPDGPGTDLSSSWPVYLKSSPDPDAKRVLATFYGLAGAYRKQVPIEAFCVAASVSPLHILEILVGLIVRFGAQASTIIAAVNQPRMVQKMVEVGLTDEGFADRMLLARATGFLPTPSGPRTTVNVNQNASASATAQAAAITPPPPEQTIRRLSDRFHQILSANAPAALPEADTSNDIVSHATRTAVAIPLEEETDE